MTEQRAETLQQVVIEALQRELEFAFDDDGTPYHPYIPKMASDVLNACRDALTISSREQLDALPDGSVVRELDVASPRVLEKYSTDTLAELYGPWVQMGFEIPTDAVVLPALLLFSPDWGTP